MTDPDRKVCPCGATVSHPIHARGCANGQLQRTYRRGLRIHSTRATRAAIAGTIGGLCGATSLRVGMIGVGVDEDALIAAVDLVGRSGAREAEIGWLHDDVPPAEAGWYATATYRGAKLIAEGPGPVEAAEALARRILDGGMCNHCKKPIALGGELSLHACRWTRMGRSWQRGCE